MLTNRLWMSVISRIRFGRPYSIWKEEYVIDFKVKFLPTTFGGELTKKKTKPGIVEVRALTFSDYDQVGLGSTVVEQMGEYIARMVFNDLAGAYLLARLDPDSIEITTAKEEREVNYNMLRNHVSALSRVLVKLLGESPPILRPWVGFIISYELDTIPRILQVCFVIPNRDGSPPGNVYEYCREFNAVSSMIAWEFKPGQPDDVVSLKDHYLTLDYDEDNMIWFEIDLVRIKSLKEMGYVDKYEVHDTGNGKHIIVWFRDSVPVYYMKRYFFHDDEYRERADEQRFMFSGVHDTLFTHKRGKRNEF